MKFALSLSIICSSARRALPAFGLALFIALLSDAQAQNTEPEISLSPGRLSPIEVKIWNDPAFRKQFAESYIAETEIEPRVTVDEREQMQKVLELISGDKLDEAAQLLEKNLAGNDAASAVFDFTLANIRFQQEKLDQAAASYNRAVEKYPKFRRAWKNLGVIAIRRGAFPDALPALTRVLELGGSDAITYGLLGYAYSSVENHLSAESAYRMAILLDPLTMDWKMGLARSLFKEERYAEAAGLCDRLLALDPTRADLWLLQANAYIGLQQPMKAAENYEIVENIGQSTVDSLNMLGDIYVNEELYHLAVDAYGQAIERDPKASPDRAIRSSKILAARGALDQTRTLVEKIEKTYGDQLNADSQKDLLKLRARLAVADGAGEEEARVLERIVELDPMDGEALMLLGQHAGRAGDVQKAIFYYERAESIEKYEPDAKVRHAQALVGAGKYDEALPLLRRAQQIKPRENVQQYLEQVERVAKTR